MLSSNKNKHDEDDYIVMQIKKLFQFTDLQKSQLPYDPDFYWDLMKDNLFGEFAQIIQKHQRRAESESARAKDSNASFNFKLYTIFNDLIKNYDSIRSHEK